MGGEEPTSREMGLEVFIFYSYRYFGPSVFKIHKAGDDMRVKMLQKKLTFSVFAGCRIVNSTVGMLECFSSAALTSRMFA